MILLLWEERMDTRLMRVHSKTWVAGEDRWIHNNKSDEMAANVQFTLEYWKSFDIQKFQVKNHPFLIFI